MKGYYPISAYYPVAEILTLSFNAIVFVLLSFLVLRDGRNRRSRWGGYLYPAAVVTLAVLFLANLANKFAAGVRNGSGLAILYVPEMAAKYLIPALVFHLFYRTERRGLPARRFCQIALAAVYAFGIVSGLAAINTAAVGWLNWYPGWPVVTLLGRVVMVCGAAGSGMVLLISRRPRTTVLDRNQRRWLIAASFLWLAAFVAAAYLPEGLGGAIEKVPALVFIAVVTYYVERLTFFDVLIKQAAFVFASLCLLMLYFVFFAPVVMSFGFKTWIGSLAWAISIWPIVVLAPWGHRQLSAWLDRLWLGRRFSPAAAAKYFLDGLEGAITEPELAGRAVERLERVFGAKVEVSFDAGVSPQSAGSELLIAPIRAGARKLGEIRIHPREHNVRLLSEDLTLLASLADALAYLLENLRLREKRLEQEQRERELILNANRSELKALRAQVNPHFLFNALNTIAGLIPRQPGRAEETIEKLADVFRYALHRSEREWVRLGEELDAVESYLDVEQARFGDALRFHISAAEGARDARIPSMIVQTLVENAVKHGIARLTTPGVVEVRAEIAGPRLRIEVRDNGPGFGEAAARRDDRAAAGYGLRNIRDRLRGHYGDAAQFSCGRDDVRGMTLASIDMPATVPAMGASPS